MIKQESAPIPVPAEPDHVKREATDPPPAKKSLMAMIFDDDDEDVVITAQLPPPTPYERATKEVNEYRREPRLDRDSDILAFWKAKATKYPLLAQVARSLLATQGSSVASERSFSTAGDIVTPTRNNLECDLVDKLIFLKRNMTDTDMNIILQKCST